MAIDPSKVKRFAHGSRVPGWDDAAETARPAPPSTAPRGTPSTAGTSVNRQGRSADDE